MPVIVINGAGTQDQYVDALTCVFTQPKDNFQLQVSNNTVFYQVAVPGQSGYAGDIVWDSVEHQLVPSLTNFDQDDAKALGARQLAGIRIRSRNAGGSAIVSVS
jgi:hypothetical protein